MHTLTALTVEQNSKLRLSYDDGETVVVDFTSLINMGGVYTSLGDPDFFSQAKIGELGAYIEWPNGLDFCADALWMEGRRFFPSS